MGNPLISVIIPNYNYARYLPERIESVLGQTFQDFEVIILDDCSTDNSREMIERYSSNPKIARIIFNEKNSGSPFVQWDKGLTAARGKYAWIAEADDLAEPTFLERLVKAINADSDVVVACSLSYIIDENGVITDKTGFDTFDSARSIEVYNGVDYIRHKMFVGNGVYNASMALFSIEAWRNMSSRRYRKMRYCGDWLFWVELMRQGSIAVVREKLNMFRKHGSSVSDEGLVNVNSLIEILTIQNLLLAMPAVNNFDRRFMFKYKYLRDNDGKLSPQELRKSGLNPSLYPVYWIYKHLFRWTRRLSKDDSSIKLVAKQTINY